MIDVVKMTPPIYSKKSRDYQLVSRLQSAIYNVSRMYINGMHVWEKDIDNKLSVLRAKTLNLDTKYSWDLDDLEALTSNFKHIQKTKGTKAALVSCINIIMKSEKIEGSITSENITIDTLGEITIVLPKKLSSQDIIEDLVRLFVPAGLLYRIVYDDSEKEYESYNSDVFIYDDITTEEKPWFEYDSEGVIVRDNEGHPALTQYLGKMIITSKGDLDSEGKLIINTANKIDETFIYNEDETMWNTSNEEV